MLITFDVRNYVSRPRMNATNAVVLAHRVAQQAQPEDGGVLDPAQKKLIRAILADASRIEVVQRERMRLKPEKLRPVMQPVANVFVAMHGGLESIARLPAEASSRSKRALRVLALAFPEGTAFVNADAESAWVSGSRCLTIIAEQELEGEVEELIGPEFIKVARSALDTLGEVLGVKGGRRLPSTVALAEALDTLAVDIARYGRYLVAQLDEADPASVAKFLRAVAPLDAHRASMRGTGGGGGEEEPALTLEPTEPGLEPGLEPLPVPDPVIEPVA